MHVLKGVVTKTKFYSYSGGREDLVCAAFVYPAA